MEVAETTSDPCSSNTEKPKKSRGHRCYFCGNKFSDVRTLKKHITTHRDRPFVCNLCEKAFIDRNTLKKHKLTHSEERTHLCEICGRAYKLHYNLMVHKATSHSQVTECFICDPSLFQQCEKKPSNLELNVSRCRSCKMKGKKITNEGLFKCSPCEVMFQTLQALEVHLAKHSKKLPKASERAETFPPNYSKELLMPANQYAMAKKAFDCTICGEKFISAKELTAHWLTHEEGPFYCLECDMKYKKCSDLKKHMLTHRNNAFYSCTICNTSFKSSFELKQHELIHTESRPFVCNVCNFAFKSQNILKKHMLTHQQDRPYECQTCGGNFKSIYCLKQHRLTHTSQKSFRCALCEKTFKYRVSCHRHMRFHTGELPYKCVLCDKKYRHPNGLRIHLRTHVDDSSDFIQQACPICGAVYKTLSRFHRHMLQHSRKDFILSDDENLEDENVREIEVLVGGEQ